MLVFAFLIFVTSSSFGRHPLFTFGFLNDSARRVPIINTLNKSIQYDVLYIDSFPESKRIVMGFSMSL